MAVLAFAALSTERTRSITGTSTAFAIALTTVITTAVLVIWGVGVGRRPVVLHLSVRLCVGCFSALWNSLALLGVSPSMTVAVVSTSSMVASRSKERMIL
jgi:hypothetical protein